MLRGDKVEGDKVMMPKAGLEPARSYPLPPQDSVSANSTTSARVFHFVEIYNML